MEMDAIFTIVLGAMVAGFVQGLSGFAFGMVAISFWAWILDPRIAATLAVFGALTGQILAAVSVRRGFELRVLWPFVAGGLLGIPIGVAVLPHMNMDWFKTVLGGMLILWCPAMLFSQRFPRITVGGRLVDGVVGVSGGVMGGIGGLSGTLPTLWCTLRGYEKDTQRAVIQNFNLSMLMVTMGVYVATGIVTREMLPMFAMVLPAMLVPTLLGTRFYRKVDAATFRTIVLTLLTGSGCALLASSVPRLLAQSG